jgi:hypothetical protein
MSLDEATEVLDGSPLSDPGQIPPQSSRRGIGLFFSGNQEEGQPEGMAEAAANLQQDSPSASPSDAGSDSGSDWPSGPDDLEEELTGPSESSADGGPLKPLGKAALKATTRKAVLISTSLAHRLAARSELEKRAGLYIADEQDQELIGDPIANVLHRRGGGVSKLSPDANDALSGLMGFANYIAKQVALIGEIRDHEQAASSEPQQVA